MDVKKIHCARCGRSKFTAIKAVTSPIETKCHIRCDECRWLLAIILNGPYSLESTQLEIDGETIVKESEFRKLELKLEDIGKELSDLKNRIFPSEI